MIDLWGNVEGIDSEVWRKLLSTWARLESSYVSMKPAALPTSKRPGAVKWWIDRARPTKLPDCITSHTEFTEQWTLWWKSMNPDWRLTDESGDLLREGSGEWGKMVAPGQNGFLSVITSLRWWFMGMQDGDSDSLPWSNAVLDVTWVMERILSRRFVSCFHAASFGV
ncbi:hypothetical protein C8J56DRAFT_776411 [Mycena floridula]|nr:hypothetical protein C8J56DRAFT_776411 [Mycena floridula]